MYPQGVCRIRKPTYVGNGCTIFPVFDTEEWAEKIRSQPQTISSEIPKEKGSGAACHRSASLFYSVSSWECWDGSVEAPVAEVHVTQAVRLHATHVGTVRDGRQVIDQRYVIGFFRHDVAGLDIHRLPLVALSRTSL